MNARDAAISWNEWLTGRTPADVLAKRANLRERIADEGARPFLTVGIEVLTGHLISRGIGLAGADEDGDGDDDFEGAASGPARQMQGRTLARAATREQMKTRPCAGARGYESAEENKQTERRRR